MAQETEPSPSIPIDLVWNKRVLSAKLDGEPAHGEIEDAEAKQRPVASLFSDKQEHLIADYLPDRTSLDELEVLGPVDARKWDLDNPEGFRYSVSLEEWSLPDATRFIELSFKVSADEATDAHTAFRALLTDLELGVPGDQTPKTPHVLKCFAERLDD